MAEGLYRAQDRPPPLYCAEEGAAHGLLLEEERRVSSTVHPSHRLVRGARDSVAFVNFARVEVVVRPESKLRGSDSHNVCGEQFRWRHSGEWTCNSSRLVLAGSATCALHIRLWPMMS